MHNKITKKVKKIIGKIHDRFIRTYTLLFSRKIFYKFNKLIYRCGLSGMGIMNYRTNRESGESFFLKSYFRGEVGGIVVDVGANVGNYSKAVLEANPTATIFAFEPHPRTYELLTKNIQISSFHPINVAVGDEVGVFSLFDYEEKDGSEHASLYKDVIVSIHKENSVEHKVEAIKLDDFLMDNKVEHISLLKIDTEGNELNVLKGAMAYILAKKIDAIHFEFNEMNVFSRTYFYDFVKLLSAYDIYRLLPHGMIKIDEYSPLYCEIFAYQNIVAILKK